MSRVNFGAQHFLYPMPVLIIGTYDENGKPRTIKQETSKVRRFINGLIKDMGYTCVNKASSGQYIHLLIKDAE